MEATALITSKAAVKASSSETVLAHSQRKLVLNNQQTMLNLPKTKSIRKKVFSIRLNKPYKAKASIKSTGYAMDCSPSS